MSRRMIMVNNDMRMGGVQRQFMVMAHGFVERGWEIKLCTWETGDSFFDIPDGVEHVKMGGAEVLSGTVGGLKMNRRRIQLLHKEIVDYQPEIIISCNHRNNVRALFAARHTGVPVIVMEASDPFREPLERLWTWLRHRTYPKAARVVLQTAPTIEYFRPDVKRIAEVIPNPVATPAQQRAPNSKGRMVCSVGRLDWLKGYDLLIEAFSTLAAELPDWKLTIFGEGPHRPDLEALVEKFGLKDRVSLPGATKDPHKSLLGGDIFVLSSRREGFPNALCEAMAVGLPIVSFKCPYGPEVIVRDGVDGLLVPPEDVSGLAEALRDLMNHPDKREAMAQRSPEILERYGEHVVMDHWQAVIDQVVTEQAEKKHDR